MSRQPHPSVEPHHSDIGILLNRLRAAVLGANDGIVSTAGLVVGVTAANPSNTAAILTAGVAGILSGAVSMGVGEYVSVSTQHDTEKALIHKERAERQHAPEAEFVELVSLYTARGLQPSTARQVATELTDLDPLATHLRVELGIDADELTSPGRRPSPRRPRSPSAPCCRCWRPCSRRPGCASR